MNFDWRASFFNKPWVRVRNTTNERIPPYAVLQPTDATMDRGEIVFTVTKPDSTGTDWYLVNGQVAIPATDDAEVPEGYGTLLTTGGYVMVDSASLALGDSAGPTDGQWFLTGGSNGFYIFGGTQTIAGNPVAVAVQRVSPSMVYGRSGRSGVSETIAPGASFALSAGGFEGEGTTFITDSGKNYIRTSEAGLYLVSAWGTHHRETVVAFGSAPLEFEVFKLGSSVIGVWADGIPNGLTTDRGFAFSFPAVLAADDAIGLRAGSGIGQPTIDFISYELSLARVAL